MVSLGAAAELKIPVSAAGRLLWDVIVVPKILNYNS